MVTISITAEAFEAIRATLPATSTAEMQLNSIWTAMPLAEKGAAAFLPVMIATAALFTLALRRTRAEGPSRNAKTAKNQWLPDLVKDQWVGIVSIIVTLVLFYLTNFWRPDNIVVYFGFTSPEEVGEKQLHLNYIFFNAGELYLFQRW